MSQVGVALLFQPIFIKLLHYTFLGQCALARELQEMEKRVAEEKKELEKMKKNENDLESALSQCHKQIEDLIRKNVVAQDKVSESLQLVEIALVEKESALVAESKIRGKQTYIFNTLTATAIFRNLFVEANSELIRTQTCIL